MEFEITKMGERGQIVIPQEFRRSMGLQKGEKFFVIEKGDTLILKRLKAPSLKEFDLMLKKSHAHAKKNRITSKDVQDAINKARVRK